MTPMKAIRQKCLDCCYWSSKEISLCPAEGCPLWPYRSGHNPARAGIGPKSVSEFKPNSSAVLNDIEGDFDEG